MPGGKWQVELRGHGFDLEDLPGWLRGPSCMVVKDGETYYCESDRFTGDDSTRIREIATEVVAELNGAVCLTHSKAQQVTLGPVSKLREDGVRDLFIHAPTIECRSKMTGNLTVAGAAPVAPVPSFQDQAMRLAASNFRVSGVLQILGQETPTWHQLAVAVELMQGDGGVGSQIVPKEPWEGDFGHTANSFEALGIQARHAPKKGWDPPADKMSYEDARKHVTACARKWIEALSAQAGS